MTLTRRDFLAGSGGALALTAAALAWAPSPGNAVATLPADRLPEREIAPAGAGTCRRRVFRDGSVRTVAWTRGGGSRRLALREGGIAELVTPRGRARLRIADPRARSAIAREMSPAVLRELLAEAARRA